MKLKNKLILSAIIALIGIPLFSNVSPNKVHADIPRYLFDSGDPEIDNHAWLDANREEFEATHAHVTKYELDHTTPHPVTEYETGHYKNQPNPDDDWGNNEEPLSKVYPNGAEYEGHGKIKVFHSPKYYRTIHNYQRQIRNEENELHGLDHQYNYAKKVFNEGDRAKSFDNKWIAKHSYNKQRHNNFSEYNHLSRYSYRRAYSIGSNKIALSKNYGPVIRSYKSYGHHNHHFYKINKLIDINKSHIYALLLKDNKNGYLFKIRYHHHYYYYSDLGVKNKYMAELEPYNTYNTSKNSIESSLNPGSKYIIYAPHTKIKHGMTWANENNLNDIFTLKGSKWIIDRMASPEWDKEL